MVLLLTLIPTPDRTLNRNPQLQPNPNSSPKPNPEQARVARAA